MPKKEMTAQEFSEEFSKQLTVVVIELTKQVEEECGIQTADDVAAAFFSTFLSTIIQRRLNRPNTVKMSKEKMCQLVMSDYNSLKLKVQDSIATGFSRALHQWSGKPTEFYCQIRPVPEPVNKQAC